MRTIAPATSASISSGANGSVPETAERASGEEVRSRSTSTEASTTAIATPGSGTIELPRPLLAACPDDASAGDSGIITGTSPATSSSHSSRVGRRWSRAIRAIT